jgi:hypothetical protein
MFRVFQLQLRNMAAAADKFLRMSRESYHANLALIDVLSEKRYEYFGLGEDILSKSPEVITENGKLSVALTAPGPGTVVFHTRTAAYAVLNTRVLLEGKGVSWQLKKTYGASAAQPPVFFSSGQLPLLSDNIQLIVAIQPGGEFTAAAVLQEITML